LSDVAFPSVGQEFCLQAESGVAGVQNAQAHVCAFITRAGVHSDSVPAGDKLKATQLKEISKEAVVIHFPLGRRLFGDGIPRRLLPRVLPVKPTSAL
jgi:hypothetical protein